MHGAVQADDCTGIDERPQPLLGLDPEGIGQQPRVGTCAQRYLHLLGGNQDAAGKVPPVDRLIILGQRIDRVGVH